MSSCSSESGRYPVSHTPPTHIHTNIHLLEHQVLTHPTCTDFVMPLVMDRSNLGNFSGVATGDIILARKFASIPKDGTDIDTLDNHVGAEVLQVADVFQNAKGEIINLNVEIIWHEDRAAGRPDVGTFRLDGDTVVKVRPGYRDRPKSFLGLYSSQGCSKFVSCAINPGGDMIRRHVLRGWCAANCEKGWLRNLDRLDAHMPEGSKMADFPHVPRFRPLCPGCMGTELVVRQIKLRVANDGARYDEEYVRKEWLPFQNAVKQRRHALRYNDLCSCVRCLMPSTSHPHPHDHAEAMEMHLGLIEYNITTAVQDIPASEDAIAALPRMRYADAKTEATYCTICQTGFAEDTAVAQLPCKHIICADECIDWLRHQNSCPECRRKIPSARVKIWTPSASVSASTQTPRVRDSANDSNDDEPEVRHVSNQDTRRTRARGELIDGSELPIGSLRVEEQPSGIRAIGNPSQEALPEGSDNWTEVDWMGYWDSMRSRQRAGSLDSDDDLEAEPFGNPSEFYANRNGNGWFRSVGPRYPGPPADTLEDTDDSDSSGSERIPNHRAWLGRRQR